MIPKYFQYDATTRDRWMISYMDVLTILLIFFVAVAARSLSSVNIAHNAANRDHSHPLASAYNAVRSPVKPAEPPPSVIAAPALRQPNRTLAEAGEKLQKQGLNVGMEARGLVISLPQTVLFSSAEDQISADALPIVAEIAEVLRDIPNRVSLVGHADSIPIHNHRFKNNWELSAARGLKLLDLLSGKYGIPESRLSVASEGSYNPKNSNDTPDGRASNRRVEIVILDEPS
jgi:chemotaxis protein MotB